MQAKKENLVTFILPTFNAEKYVCECIESIKNQCNMSWSLEIWDDCSTDNTLEILARLLDPRININVNTHNLGLYATLNKAIAKVKTPWTSFIFQDDVLDRNYLDTFLSLSMRYRGVDYFWAEINIIDYNSSITKKGLDTGRVELIKPSRNAWKNVMKQGTIWTISGSFNRTSSLRSSNFDENLPHCADWDFILSNLFHTSFVYAEIPLVGIRIHELQQSSINLAIFKDLKERNQVILKQIFAHGAERFLRLQLAYIIFKSCIIRGLSRAKRGKLSRQNLISLVSIACHGSVSVVFANPSKAHAVIRIGDNE